MVGKTKFPCFNLEGISKNTPRASENRSRKYFFVVRNKDGFTPQMLSYSMIGAEDACNLIKLNFRGVNKSPPGQWVLRNILYKKLPDGI